MEVAAPRQAQQSRQDCPSGDVGLFPVIVAAAQQTASISSTSQSASRSSRRLAKLRSSVTRSDAGALRDHRHRDVGVGIGERGTRSVEDSCAVALGVHPSGRWQGCWCCTPTQPGTRSQQPSKPASGRSSSDCPLPTRERCPLDHQRAHQHVDLSNTKPGRRRNLASLFTNQRRSRPTNGPRISLQLRASF